MHSTEREQKAPARSLAATVRVGLIALISLLGAGFGASACLNRPLCDKDCRPRTTNIFVQTVVQKTVDKIDLLFMIDNSISMADKQAVLKEAVPDLVKRLVSPNCVDGDGKRGNTPEDPDGPCENGFAREFNPIKNIHIGVVTSSLGGHGADACKGGTATLRDEEENDHGYLIATRPRYKTELAKAEYAGAQAAEQAGFLDWEPALRPNKKQDIGPFNKTFQAMVTASSEFGCGYESQLEAVYRFLADPKPYASIRTDNCPGSQNPCAYPQGVDTDLQNQRAAFLRPDSLVAIIMVTDENDCSIQDTQQAYYAARDEIFLPRATAICGTNPNDRCCVSCVSGTPSGCQEDPTCKSQPTTPKDADQANLRCFNQKKRFGFDFLYPTARYVNMLKQSQLCTSRTDLAVDPSNPNDCRDGDGDGKPDLFPNPLFADLTGKGSLPREPSLVFFAGIVGVPWQDLQATKDKDGKDYPDPNVELHYKIASQMRSDNTWNSILGDPAPSTPPNAAPIAPTNTLMLESIDARGGKDGQGVDLVGVNGTVLQNPVNSHEWGNTNRDDLMYACVFKLKDKRDCAQIATQPDPQPGCDCKKVVPGDNNPLCQNPANNQYGTDQYFAKAYPGLRELQVLKDFGDNSIVASICARNLNDNTRQDYGYRPAVDAIVDRLKEALTGRCLPRVLKPDQTTGKIPCSIIEVRPIGANCNEDGRNRTDAPQEVIEPARQRLKAGGTCDGQGQPRCSDFVFCTLGEAGEECHHNGAQTVPGWCYVDPGQKETVDANGQKVNKTPQQIADEETLVQKCADNEKRIIRFVDPLQLTPAPDAKVLIACFGADISDDNAPSVTFADGG